MRHNTIERLTGMNVPVPDDIKQMDRLKRRANTRLSQYRDRGWSVERIDVPSEIEFDTGQAPQKDGVQQENFQEEETDLDPTK